MASEEAADSFGGAPRPALSALRRIESSIRDRLGSRLALAAIVAPCVLSVKLGEDWIREFRRSPLEAAAAARGAVNAELWLTFDELEFPELYFRIGSTGRVEQAAEQIADVLLMLSERQRVAACRELLLESGANIGEFNIPPHLAKLTAAVAIHFGSAAIRQAVQAGAALKVFDPRLGNGSVTASVVRELRGRQVEAVVSGCEPLADRITMLRVLFALDGISADAILQSDWLEEHRTVGSDFNLSVTAIPGAPWRMEHLARPETFAAFPRATDATLLYVTKITQLLREKPGATAVLREKLASGLY